MVQRSSASTKKDPQVNELEKVILLRLESAKSAYLANHATLLIL